MFREMARLICYTIVTTISVLFVSTFSMNPSDANDYVLLITAVRDYYKTSYIVIVHSNRCTDLNETTLAYLMFRSLSHNRILTMIISFHELSRETEKYRSYITRPLYVVLLSTKEAMDEFAMASKQIDVSYPVWLVMFLPHRGDPLRKICNDPIGNPFNLSFNTEMLVLCYDLPILREWYALRDNRTRMFDLATWKPGEKIDFKTDLGLYARRNNMFGETLRIAYVEDSPFVSMRGGNLSLFLGGLICELSKTINFTIKVESSLESYGSWSEEERDWTGVIGEVVSRKVDFGVSEFSMTKHRLDNVDFTVPLILSRNRIYFKRPSESSVPWPAYFKTFHTSIWTAIVGIIASTPILLTVIKTKGRVKMSVLADNYISVWGIYCQQALAEFPSETPMRLAFLSIFASALIILSAYSASLISYLTVSTVSLPFNTLEGLADDGSYKLITFKNSSDYDNIISNDQGVYVNLKKLLKEKDELPLTINDAFHQVCSEKVGFFVAKVLIDAMNSTPCEVIDIAADSIDSMAMVLNKNSPYTDVINYYLQRLKDNGVLNKLKHTFLQSSSSQGNGYNTVTLDGIVPLLVVLAGGTLLACLILLLERMYHNSRGSKVETSQFIFCRMLDRNLETNRQAKKGRSRSLGKERKERSQMFYNRSYYEYYE